MPDAQPVEIPAMTALAFGIEGKQNPVSNIAPEAFQTASELRALRSQQGGREALRRLTTQGQQEHLSYAPDSAEVLKLRFGAGAASLNPDGRAVLGGSATPEQRAVFEQAAAAIDRSSIVLTYLQLITESNSTERTKQFNELKRDPSRAYLQKINNFDNLENQVLTIVESDPLIQRMFPELYAQGITSKERCTYLQQALLSDPVFRAKIGERMAQVYEAALRLPEVQADSRVQEKKQNLATQEATFKQQLESLSRLLQENGITITSDQIADLIRGASTTPMAVDRILIESLRLQGINNPEVQYQKAKKYFNLQERESQLEELLSKMELQYLDTVDLGGSNDPNMSMTLIDRLKNDNPQYTRLRSQYDSTTTELASLQAELKKPQSDFARAVTIFEDSISPLLTAGATAQNPNGEFASLVAQLKRTQINIERLNQEIAGLEAAPTAERLTQEKQRLIQEKRLLGQLESVVGVAALDVIDSRYEEMEALERKRQEQEAKKQEEQARETAEKKAAKQAVLLRQIQKEMNERWIKIDQSIGKTIDCSAIVADMDMLIYQGENGLRRLFLRSMFGSGQFQVSRIASDGSKTTVTITSYNDFNFVTDELIGEDKEIFEALYQAESKNYRDKLMRDYFYARAMSERPGRWLRDRYKDVHFNGNVRDLRLKDYELEALYATFGSDIETALNKSKEAQQVIQTLKDKGIKVDSKEWKWLMYILLVLFGGAALLISPALGIGGAAGTVAAEKIREKIASS